jgi:hypothetical protein
MRHAARGNTGGKQSEQRGAVTRASKIEPRLMPIRSSHRLRATTGAPDQRQAVNGFHSRRRNGLDGRAIALCRSPICGLSIDTDRM